ncbi:MAG TPA: hypothetical protein VFS14_01195 [Candidatus Saccharimonadales bacterium]|nr:hypothetical protein [Candidatus Saccharimonadales bacterium]
MAETLTRTPDTAAEPTRLHLVSVDQSYDAHQAARDAANERLTEELNEGGRFKRMLKSVWKGGALREYYQHKYTREAQANIEATGNVLLYQASTEQSQRARWATIDRFLNENDEVIHTSAGESREEIASDAELNQEVKELIRRNVEGDLSDEAMVEEKARLLAAYHEARGDQAFGRGVVQVDNMVEIAAAVKGAVDHGESLDAVLANMKISMGEARSGVRTEARYNKVEKIADKLSRSRLGSLVGPETVATATTLAASLLRFGSHSVVGAATKTIAPGIAAGAWAGLRENKRMKDERAQHLRERAQGKEIQAGSRRREQLEETRYETAAATDLTDMLRQHFGEEADFTASKDAYEAAMAALSAVETRISLSDERKLDLISFSDAGMVEEERFALDLARAEAKVAARNRLTDDVRRALGVDADQSLEDMISERSEAFLESVETDLSQKDKVFKRLKRREVAKAAAKGAVIGLAFGAITQEGIAALSDTRQGLIEQAWGATDQPYEGTMHQTLLHGLVHGSDGGNFTELHHEPSGDYTSHAIGEHGTISVSSDQSLTENADGTLLLRDHNGNTIADNLTTNRDGSLTAESLQRLNDSGSHVENLSHTVDLPPKVETHQGSLSEYMDAHKSETTHVSRDYWYDNNTEKFDKNELGLWWGGENNNGLTGDGGYQFDISHMTQGGSSHDGQNLAWQEAARRGELKLAISASGNTQTQVFMIDINPDGTATIPKDSPAAQFFSERGGQASFDGKYAEVVQTTKPDADGVTHIRPLATEVGNDTARTGDFPITKEVPVKEFRPEYKITSNGYDTQEGQPTFTEMAPVIPLVPRRALEVVQRVERPGYYYGYDSSPERLRRFRKEECSPRLNRDPKARLNPREELDWHRGEIRRRAGADYADGVDRAIDDSPELRSLPADTKAIVTIPIAAASESDNIYRTLASYAGQDAELDRTTILLHVNWFDSAEGDPAKAASIQKTWDEIERARRDFPQLRIATMKSVWEEAKKRSGEYGDGIAGHMARKMYDTALMSVQRAMAEGRMDDDHEVLLIRNDSDAQGIRRTYLQNMIKSFEQHPENDVFTGAIRWGTERHTDLPGFAFVSNFREVMHIATKRRGVNVWPPTVGINTAVRMSTFAAVNGIGYDPKRTGIGTDDYNIGGRIKDARQIDVWRARAMRHFWNLRSNSGRTPNTYGYGYPAEMTHEDYSYHRHVGGADIDTAPDRLEKAYLAGIPITRAWDNWGNQLRDEGLVRGATENLRSNPGEVISRVEADMSASFTERFHDRAHVRAGLAAVLPTSIGGRPAYTITRTSGGMVFRFTPEGRAWFVNRLQRDSKGRYDPIGRRVRRKLYHETNGGRAPRTSQPLMV